MKKIKDLKKYFNNEYIKEHLNIVILGILILIFLVAIIIYFLLSGRVSKIEKEKIINDTTPYINYLEDIENSKSKDIDKYIIYTLDYFTYEKGQNNLKTEEIADFISTTFNKKVTKEDVKNYGISPSMLEKNIVYNIDNDTYTLFRDKTNVRELENKPVVYYKREKISIYNKKKYKVKYSKYVIDNPLDLLNYIIEYNTKVKKQEDEIDITNLREYLQTGNISKIKYFLNENDFILKKYAKKKKNVKVTYKVNNDNSFKIYKIK